MSRKTSVTARYSLYDTSAAEDGVLSMDRVQPFSDFSQLLDEEQSIGAWATLEANAFVLDGGAELFPEETAGVFAGVWSDRQSGYDGSFAQPPVFTVTFSAAHTTGGITLVFSESTEDWCSHLTIEWFDQSGASLASMDYHPDRANYFCEKQVENFYKLQITFRQTNKPYHFLKLTGIRYGVAMELGGSMLVSCTVLEELNPISSEISVNTLQLRFRTDGGEFDLLDLTGAYALFQQRQKVDVTGSIDGVDMNMGSFYLEVPTVSDNIVTLECIDLVGTMDDTDYLGGYWPDGIPAGQLIDDIMRSAGLEADMYTVESSLANIQVRGYLAIQTHRSALQQVAFAVGAVVDCSRSEKISIRQPPACIPKTVPVSRKVVGHKQTQEALVTGVEVFIHHYALDDTISELFSETRQPGDYLIQFSRPASSLSVSGATVDASGVNYAKIHVASAGTVTITGRVYEETQILAGSVHTENLPANAKINVKTVTECTLESDAQALAQRVYDHCQRRIEDDGQIILADEQAGDWLEVRNAGGKTLLGTAEQVSIDLTGGFIAKVVTHGIGQTDL